MQLPLQVMSVGSLLIPKWVIDFLLDFVLQSCLYHVFEALGLRAVGNRNFLSSLARAQSY